MFGKDKNLQNVIAQNNRDPFYILEQSGDIINSNSAGTSLLKLKTKSQRITSYFEKDTADHFEQYLEKVVEQNKLYEVQSTELVLRNGEKFKAKLIFNCYESENSRFILCTIIPQKFDFDIRDEESITLSAGDIDKIINNDEINFVLKKIVNVYPLTFIGKETIKRLVDNLEEHFWIKDNKGKFLLVNNAYAESLGLKPYQIEGKSFQEFIPGYLIEFFEAVERYIKETLNCIIIDAFPVTRMRSDADKEILELPLSDIDKNVVALVGISREKKQVPLLQPGTELTTGLGKIIDQFPKPAALVNKYGVFRQTSKEFSKLFARKFNELRDLNFSDVFALDLTDKINQFVKSTKDNIEISVDRNFDLNEFNIPEYKIYLTKSYGAEKDPTGFSIFVEPISNTDSLQYLIEKKGKMFDVLVKNNPESVFIYDKENLMFLEVNEAAVELYGYTRDEFLQMDLTDLYSPEDIQTLLDTSSQDVENIYITKSYRHKKKDGSSVLVEVSRIGFKYNDRDAHYNVVKDITQKLELERKTQLSKIVFDNTNDIVFLTDPAGIITSANKAAAERLGFSPTDLEGSSFTSHVPDEERASANQLIFQAEIKERVDITSRMKNSIDEIIDVELNITPLLDVNGEVEYFTILAKPISASTRITGEEKIKEVIKEVIVEKPVESETNVGQSNSEFLSGVFHEILTPMNVILGFAQEIAEGSENASAEQKEAMEIINQNRMTLLNTMNSILEFTEIEKAKSELNISEFKITDLIDKLDKNIVEITGKKDIEFAYGKISSSLKFNTDVSKFEILINNLLRLISRKSIENKIYFSAYSIDDHLFIISVSDNYASTSNELNNLLQQLFTDHKDPKELGVSKITAQITRTLLEILDGKFVTIPAESGKIESGFQFPVKMVKEHESIPDFETEEETIIEEETDVELDEPVVQDEIEFEEETAEELVSYEEEIESEDTIADKIKELEAELKDDTLPEKEIKEEQVIVDEKLDLSKLSCLYIEDQVDSQLLFKVQMKGLKDIQCAKSFEESAPMLELQQFDFIVIDINLQGEYNGLDALKIIHKMPGLENIPVIAVTAYVLPGDKEKFVATGFNDFVSKPIFREKIVDVLEKIFNK